LYGGARPTLLHPPGGLRGGRGIALLIMCAGTVEDDCCDEPSLLTQYFSPSEGKADAKEE
jgi:hypothetical protein